MVNIEKDLTKNSRKFKLSNNNTKVYILFFLIGLSILQQMPIIKEQFYTEIRIALLMIFGTFTFLSLHSSLQYLKVPFYKFFLVVCFYITLLGGMLTVFLISSIDIFEMLIPFGILVCSLNTDFTKKQINHMLFFYVFLATILGLSTVMYYNGGFAISEVYSIPNKNQVGPIIGISSIIIGIKFLNLISSKFNLKLALLYIVMFSSLVTSLLVFRNRSSIVGILITLLLYSLFKLRININYRNLFIYQTTIIILFIIVILGGFDNIASAIWTSFTLNYDLSSVNSFSAQRTDVYSYATKYILENPILGELGGDIFNNYTAHNYLLNKWVSYGFVISIPLTLFYIYLWGFSLKFIFLQKKSFENTGVWILFFSLIISLFEYTFPYGPGVSQLMVWLLLGQHIKNSSKSYDL